jgi:predicted RNA-binding protein with RPS1 domain
MLCKLLVLIAIFQIILETAAFRHGWLQKPQTAPSSKTLVYSKAKSLDSAKRKMAPRYEIGAMVDSSVAVDEEDKQEELIDTQFDIKQLFEEEEESGTFQPPKLGDIVTGYVLDIDDNGVLVEIAGKVSAFLPITEASLIPVTNLAGLFEIGQEVTGEIIDKSRGTPILSLRSAQLEAAWLEVHRLKHADEAFEVDKKNIVIIINTNENMY